METCPYCGNKDTVVFDEKNSFVEENTHHNAYMCACGGRWAWHTLLCWGEVSDETKEEVAALLSPAEPEPLEEGEE